MESYQLQKIITFILVHFVVFLGKFQKESNKKLIMIDLIDRFLSFKMKWKCEKYFQKKEKKGGKRDKKRCLSKRL